MLLLTTLIMISWMPFEATFDGVVPLPTLSRAILTVSMGGILGYAVCAWETFNLLVICDATGV